jgi:hypothetical protein
MYALIVAIKVIDIKRSVYGASRSTGRLQKRQTLARGAAQNGCRVVHFRASDPRNCPRPDSIADAKMSKSPIIGRLIIRHATCLSICGVVSNPSFRPPARRVDANVRAMFVFFGRASTRASTFRQSETAGGLYVSIHASSCQQNCRRRKDSR